MNKKIRPTLKDVARLANCSTAVVSTVVNNARGNTLVSEQMRQRVHKTAAQLGYRPNYASRSLVRQSSETIGLYVPPSPWAGMGLPYEGAIISGIEQACQEHAHDLLAINLGGKGSHENCANKFFEGRIDGLILLHLNHYNVRWVDDLLKANRNIIAVNYYGQTKGLKTINFDDRAAVRLAVEHLLDIGHRRIGWVGSRYDDLGPGARLRREGYEQAMSAAGLEPDKAWVWDFVAGAGRSSKDLALSAGDAIEHFWSQTGELRPTAIVCYSDVFAAGALARCRQMDIRVPEQLNIVGVDDSEICKYTSPKLTSIRQPLEMMGYQAANSLIESSDHAQSPSIVEAGPSHLLSEPKLVVRESTSPIDEPTR